MILNADNRKGTNNLNHNPADNDPKETAKEALAPGYLADLIDFVVDAAPDATVIVAQIVLAADPRVTAKIKKFNLAIPAIIKQRRDAGKHVLMVDMSSIDAELLVQDGVHPNAFGYQKMADIWYQGIKDIPAGWLKAPSKAPFLLSVFDRQSGPRICGTKCSSKPTHTVTMY